MNLVLATTLQMLAAVESRLHVDPSSFKALDQRQSTANETARELVWSEVERLNESLAGLTKQLGDANLTLTSDGAALKDAVLAQGTRQKQLNVSLETISAQLVSLNASMPVLHAQHIKAAERENARMTAIVVQLDQMKASVLALDAHSKMLDASMGEAVERQKQEAKKQAQALEKVLMELAQEQKKLVLQAVQEQIGPRAQKQE